MWKEGDRELSMKTSYYVLWKPEKMEYQEAKPKTNACRWDIEMVGNKDPRQGFIHKLNTERIIDTSISE